MWRDLDRTCAELARSRAPMRMPIASLLADWQSLSPMVNAERENPPRPPDEVAARTQAGPLGDRGLEIAARVRSMSSRNASPRSTWRAFFAWIAFMTLHPSTSRDRAARFFARRGAAALQLILLRVLEPACPWRWPDHRGAWRRHPDVEAGHPDRLDSGRATAWSPRWFELRRVEGRRVDHPHCAPWGRCWRRNLTPETRRDRPRGTSVTMFVVTIA